MKKDEFEPRLSSDLEERLREAELTGPDLDIPRRSRRVKRRNPVGYLLVCVLIGVLLGTAVGMGGAVLRSRMPQLFVSVPKEGDSSAPIDDGFNNESPGDVEQTGAQASYQLAAYQGKTDGLAVTLSENGTEELDPVTLYQQCRPATVSITVYAGNNAAYGSGMVVTPDGFILTCSHVIENTETAWVTDANGKRYEAQLVGSDPQTDLAILKIKAKKLPCVTFADSEGLMVGESVYAIGDPLGPQFGGTLTDGILSGINRHVSSHGYAMAVLQTTAPVNSGNSGGALFNRFGQVIGVVTMKMSGGDYAPSVENMGLAVPTATVQKIVEAIATVGSVERAVLGVSCYGINETAAHVSHMPQGLWVTSIEERSHIAEAGILKGDIITAVNGVEVDSVVDFKELTKDCKPGDTVTLTVWRDEALAETAQTEEDSPAESIILEENELETESAEPVEYHFEYCGEFEVQLISSFDLE